MGYRLPGRCRCEWRPRCPEYQGECCVNQRPDSRLRSRPLGHCHSSKKGRDHIHHGTPKKSERNRVTSVVCLNPLPHIHAPSSFPTIYSFSSSHHNTQRCRTHWHSGIKHQWQHFGSQSATQITKETAKKGSHPTMADKEDPVTTRSSSPKLYYIKEARGTRTGNHSLWHGAVEKTSV